MEADAIARRPLMHTCCMPPAHASACRLRRRMLLAGKPMGEGSACLRELHALRHCDHCVRCNRCINCVRCDHCSTAHTASLRPLRRCNGSVHCNHCSTVELQPLQHCRTATAACPAGGGQQQAAGGWAGGGPRARAEPGERGARSCEGGGASDSPAGHDAQVGVWDERETGRAGQCSEAGASVRVVGLCLEFEMRAQHAGERALYLF